MYPSLDDVLTHQAPMRLLDELIEVGSKHVHCRVTASADCLFYDPAINAIPGWIGIEFMAQTVAAWSGFHAWQQSMPPSIGFLLGSRRYQTDIAHFNLGDIIDVHAEHLLENNGIAVFMCRIKLQGKIVASAQLNAFIPSKEKIKDMLTRKAE